LLLLLSLNQRRVMLRHKQKKRLRKMERRNERQMTSK
jgi:hypothetical protein